MPPVVGSKGKSKSRNCKHSLRLLHTTSIVALILSWPSALVALTPDDTITLNTVRDAQRSDRSQTRVQSFENGREQPEQKDQNNASSEVAASSSALSPADDSAASASLANPNAADTASQREVIRANEALSVETATSKKEARQHFFVDTGISHPLEEAVEHTAAALTTASSTTSPQLIADGKQPTAREAIAGAPVPTAEAPVPAAGTPVPTAGTPVPTAGTPESLDVGEQRFHYQMAKSALRKKDWREFDKHLEMARAYPLLPYLEYGRLTQNLKERNSQDIDEFLNKHGDSYLSKRLVQQWLYTLGLKGRWDEFLRYANLVPPLKRELRCFELQAQLSLGNDDALDQVSALWPAGKSHPKLCDPLFALWKKEGRLTSAIAWKRFVNAMKKKNTSIARYSMSLMNAADHKNANLFMRVHGYPYTMKKRSLFSDQTEAMQEIIAHGTKRYARKDPIGALRQWEFYEAQHLFSYDLTVSTKLYIVKRLISKGHTQEAEQLVESSMALRQATIIERMARESLKNQDWDKVAYWIGKLDADTKASNRWQYWLARAKSEIDENHRQYSMRIYRNLAQHRSFYGFLAADILGQSYSLEHVPAEVDSDTLAHVADTPAMIRAKELWLLGNRPEAQAEWSHATAKMDTKSLVAAGKLAREWGWYNKGIHAMISGNLWNHLSLRFPLAYRDEIQRVSSSTNIDEKLIYAIARQESAFAVEAKSRAGARGLMQLMPATARQTARKAGMRHQLKDLYKPEHNMQLGSKYLNELLQRYEGNRILATAAYNAGPHRVKRWLETNPQQLPFDAWIETIPFKETRGYVQNVLAYSVIYGYRLGTPSSLITEFEANNPF